MKSIPPLPHPSRRDFIKQAGTVAALASAGHLPAWTQSQGSLLETFKNPPRQYTVVPFWFLNDDLDEAELKRQMDDFIAHGVYGIVPHARIGLPEDIGWMSERWMHYLEVIVEYAHQKDMLVILYDEGMYPSGSCHGQVVAANPEHATRSVERIRKRDAKGNEDVLFEDDKYVYVQGYSGGTIRGVHFGTDDGEPGAPPSADILNPEAVASFLHLTHDKHYERLGKYFGNTIQSIFTDEPDTMGRGKRRGTMEWTPGFEDYLKDYLGYDFITKLPALWGNTIEDAEQYRQDFERAVNARLEETYYKPYSEWCVAHGVELTGHPAGPMDMGTLKYFQMPGQDVVWRYLEPFQDKSLEGPQSTMGKCSASAQVNYGRKRNMNECFGAYGWEFTYEEMRWVTDWLLVRGTNMIIPHAFYYSVRGKRRDERPPDVGPNNVWWDDYKVYADYCRRISWLLAEGKQVCHTAILGTPIHLPWRAARVCFEHQHDFNYLDTDTLLQHASVDSQGITVGNMRYGVLVVDGAEPINSRVLKKLKPMIDAGLVTAYKDTVEGIRNSVDTEANLIASLGAIIPPDVQLKPANPHIRYHHMQHGKEHCYFFTNEGPDRVEVALSVRAQGTKT